jgi:phosphatidylinositol-3-phosphatase
MENEASSSIYGSSDAPYLNGLIDRYAHATAFADPLPDPVPSEPHYVWMEAGTNAFSDTTFLTDDDPSASNSTKSTAHLATQMNAASPPVSWMASMEGLNASTGACPVSSSGFYVAKHDPFVFFQDTSGNPPSKSNATCAAHHQAYTTAAFGQALSQGTVARYNFITPDVCHDMHGDPACPSSNDVAAGDAWLSANLPPIIDFVDAHQGVLFIIWDEPEGGSPLMPFVAIGPGVKMGYTGGVSYTHSSFTKSIDEIFGLPVLSTVTGANDLGDLFQPAMFP